MYYSLSVVSVYIVFSFTESRDNEVGIATGYELDDQRGWSLTPGGG
jgi:hypothetical protein